MLCAVFRRCIYQPQVKQKGRDKEIDSKDGDRMSNSSFFFFNSDCFDRTWVP